MFGAMRPAATVCSSFFVSFVLFAFACGGASGPPRNVDPKFAEVAEIHHTRCGGCHRRVEPGERTREKFTSVLPRHHDRVKNLSDAQWALMLDYLSADTK